MHACPVTAQDRNFGPVAFNVSGSVDLVIPFMDHGWCFAYTCQKRLSNFHTWVPSGTFVNITMRGNPPSAMRLWWPYASSEEEIIVAMSYEGKPNRKLVWIDGVGRLDPLAVPPVLGDSNGHGAFHFDHLTTILTVKMFGGAPIEVRAESMDGL